MSYEKSCGAIIFIRSEEIKYLIIHNKKGNVFGHWGFPKGHVEENETELETAKREILEETGLTPDFIDGFRVISTYSPKKDVTKDAIYFLAESDTENVTIQQSEVAEYKWCNYADACKLVTYDSGLLKKANDFINHSLK